MRKNIEIHGIKSIEERSKQPFEKSTILISIGDTDAKPPMLIHKPEHILRLEFEDVTLHEIREACDFPEDIMSSDEKLIEVLKDNDITVFSKKTAKKISSFVIKHFDNANTIICQCHYGQGRSAGCAAAINEFYYGNGIDIFADERYSPNKLVYRLLIEALRETNPVL